MPKHASDEFIGKSIGSYILSELVGEGTFSFVVKGADPSGKIEKAFKLPRANSESQGEKRVPTRVFLVDDNSLLEQEGSPLQILRIQIARNRGVVDRGLVEIEDFAIESDDCYCRMPLLPGVTMRQYMQAGPVPVKLLADIAGTLGRLSKIPSFEYHGDVKPENMMVTDDGVVMVDCGYFGDTAESKSLIVTTPRYYPTMKADDLLAFGLMLWEIACGEPLFVDEESVGQQDPDTSRLSESLLSLLENYELDGNRFYSSIRDLKAPSRIKGGMPAIVEALLLRAVRIRIADSDYIDIDPGFESFESLETELRDLEKHFGIYFL